MENNTLACINCGTEIKGAYCHACGQPAKPDRLTLLSLGSDYLGRVFSLDTKFLRTLKDLTINPGLVSLDFILGNRVKYVPPVSYFLIIVTLFIIYLSIIDVKFSEMIATTQQAMNPEGTDEKSLKLQQMFTEQFVKNMRTFFLFSDTLCCTLGKNSFQKIWV